MRSISQDQINFYNEKGYLIVENVLSQNEIKELGSITDNFVEKSKNITKHNEDFDIEPGHSKENPKLRRIKKPEKQHSIYEKTLKNPKILDVVEDLIGPNIRTLGGKLNMKAPGGGAQVEWHTDWAFYPHTNDDILEVGIPLDDMEIENGCLMAIPGSHKWEAISHHEDGVFVGAVSENDFNMEDAVPFVLKAGSISLHHVRALHGSAPNMSNRPRRLLLQGYLAADAFPLQSNLSTSKDWNEWNSNMLRGESTNRPRLENVPVVFPQPKPEGAGSIFEIQENLKKSHYN
tara:strand:+ start:152 stop:1021 length:870 start_codon:yes stop_codon:yes gene_type:complete